MKSGVGIYFLEGELRPKLYNFLIKRGSFEISKSNNTLLGKFLWNIDSPLSKVKQLDGITFHER